jgi:D-lyxose ketol-isomerase
MELAQVQLSQEESQRLDVVDFGLRDLSRYGVQVVEYINNDRYCSRQLVFLPRQTIPEHMHPPVGEDPGKDETFRVVWGKVWAYTEGQPSNDIAAILDPEEKRNFTVFHQIELNAGEQCTILHNQYHWFQAGEEGAVVIEFSSPARDLYDVFTNPRVVRTIF